MTTQRKESRYPTVVSLPVASAPIPTPPPLPVPPEYSKPPAHCIYYASGTPAASTLDILAKYSSISTSMQNVAQANRWGDAARGIMARNAAVEFYCYSIMSEQDVRGFDYTGYSYSGVYDHAGAKLTDANWLLRDASGNFYNTFPNGTFYPNRGAWAAGVSYALNDMVLQGGIYYKCTIAHTSPGSFSTASGWTSSLGTMAVNFLPDVLPDHGGLDWATYYARYVHDIATRDMVGWEWTGSYLDAGIGYPDETIPLNWLNDGVNRTVTATPAVKRKMEEFATAFVTELQTQFGAGHKIIGNCNNGTLGTEFLVTQGKGVELCDGNLSESAIAPHTSWSLLCFAGVSGNSNAVVERDWGRKTTYTKDSANHRSILGCNPDVATNYSVVRLGIALALMRDGRAAVAPILAGGYTAAVPPWYDEWDQQLGVAIDPVQSLPVSGQIWKRRFQNGVVIINQSQANVGASRGVWATGTAYAQYERVTFNDGTNRTYICRHGQGHTSGTFATDFAAGRWHRMTGTTAPNLIAGAPVAIDNAIIPYGIYKRFNGTQDPTHNSGATVSGSFSLAGWDAILLLCVTPGVHA